MEEYMKIKNLFMFNEKHEIEGESPLFKALKDIVWTGTEKIDGTNVRIYWDGHEIKYAGRTDKADMPKELKATLDNIFMNQEMEYLFEQIFENKEAYIFGEGYGPKIQNGGGYSKATKFIVFDITIDGFELNRENVNDVAKKLGLDYVPTLYVGNLNGAIEYVKENHKSEIAESEDKKIEGLVLTPCIDIYDRRGHRIKCKCKYRDVKKYIMED